MDKMTKWLLAGFVYMLGVMGTFLVAFFDERAVTSSDMAAVERAAIKAALWPIELIRLVL